MMRRFDEQDVTVFKTILAAIDPLQQSDRVLQAVQLLKLPSDGRVILAHVMVANDRTLDQAADQPQSQGSDLPYRHIEKQLQDYQTQLDCASQIEIVMGDPSEEILRLARIHQADLIVLGSRGLTGMERILQQSVSSQVVAEAACSVFVVQAVLSAEG